MTTQTTRDPLARFRTESGALEPFAFPGGYPVVYQDRDGSTLCANCANKSDSDPDEVPQFKPFAASILETSGDDDEYPEACDGCSKPLDIALQSED